MSNTSGRVMTKHALSIFLGLILIPLFSTANSLESWKTATVKTQSFPCLGGRPLFEGTGLIIQHQNKIQVLTSEHVLIHSQKSTFCHEVVLGDGTKIKAHLARASFASGLALLNPLDISLLRDSAIPLEKLSTTPPSASVMALGFPKGSTQLQTLKDGQIINSASVRAFIPEAKQIVEAAGLPVEYGMSGGLLLSEKKPGNYAIVGLLSHQVLKRTPSQQTQLEYQGPASENRQNDLALSISVSDIQAWVQSPEKTIEWLRDPAAQLQGQEVLLYGPLRLSLERSPVSEIFAVGGFHQGGADGSGIGGADSSGIGGSEASSSALTTKETIAIVNVSLANDVTPQLKIVDLKNAILNSWKLELLKGKKGLKVPFLRQTQEIRLKEISSLSQFLKLWTQDNLLPVALFSTDSKDFANVSNQVLSLIQAQRENTDSVLLKSWLGWIRDQIVLSRAGLISSADLQKVFTGDNEILWTEYYSTEFDNAVDLSTALQSLSSAMKKVGL